MKHQVFSFGSNSIAQLRGRVLNPTLQATPAYVDNWSRVFCNCIGRWGDSGVASLHPNAGARTYGSVVALSNEELCILDGYEAQYHKTFIDIMVKSNEIYEPTQAFTYISDYPYWQTAPSEQYLTAIHVHLRQHHPSDISYSISVCGVLQKNMSDAPIETIYTWKYPGKDSLSLPALMVEVNSRKSAPWVMPSKIGELSSALSTIGIQSAAQLAVLLYRDEGVSLNKKLTSAGQVALSDEEVVLFMRCFEI
jgi:hypothetical protein